MIYFQIMSECSLIYERLVDVIDSCSLKGVRYRLAAQGWSIRAGAGRTPNEGRVPYEKCPNKWGGVDL